MEKCWDLKGCPASHYLKCQAYARDISCWIIKEGCLCNTQQVCGDCPIYQEYLSVETMPST